MEGLLLRLLILSRSIIKRGRRRQFLFLIGRFFKISSDFLPSFGLFGQAVSDEKIFRNLDQSERKYYCGGHFCKRIGKKLAIFKENRP
jgi:hypothetical protein